MQRKSVYPWKKVAAVVVTTALLFGSVSDTGLNHNSVIDFATPLSVEAYSNGNYKVKTSGSNLNVRSGPGTGYGIVGSLTNGFSFTVYETSGNWGKISSSSQWVCLDYSTYVSSPSSGSSSGKTGKGIVDNCSALNVRSGPGTSYGVKTTLNRGTAVNITSTSGNWGYDSVHSGYVSLNYINFSSSGGGNNSSSGSSGSSSNYISLTSGRIYMFEPMCAPGKVVDVDGWGKANCTNVHIWSQGKKQANQIFKPIDLGNGYYAFMDTNSGKVLDVSGGTAKDGANVIIYDYHGGANQQWRIIYTGTYNGHAYYSIQSKINSNYYLDVSGASSGNGTNVQLYKGNGTSAQKFILWYYTSSTNNTNNTTIIDGGGHSEFKPRQQANYNNSFCKKCSATLSSSGCGALATVNAVGYLTGKQMDIATVANVCRNNDMHACGQGGRWSVPQVIANNMGSSYGFKFVSSRSFGSKSMNGNSGYPIQSEYDSVWSDLVSHLKKGEVAVTLVHGHFIAIVAYNSSTNKVLVYDSAAGTSRGTTTNGDWKSYNELNYNSSEGKVKLKLRSYMTFLSRT